MIKLTPNPTPIHRYDIIIGGAVVRFSRALNACVHHGEVIKGREKAHRLAVRLNYLMANRL